MFVALDENKNRVSIEDAVRGKLYYCPSCGEPLIVKAKESLAVRAYFSHKKGTDCDTFTHDMSDWHLGWQMKFPIENREVVIEKDGVKHRADVFINDTVIEFQHSPITADEIAKRNEFYLSCGYKVIWIFDADDQLKNAWGDSIDPVECRNGGLCWKRAKRQFANKMPQNVFVFLQYKTPVGDPKLNGQPIDVMVFLQDIDPKDVRYFNTQISDTQYLYLRPDYFLKDFGFNEDPESVSLSAIINASVQYWNNYSKRAQQRTVYVQGNRRYFPRYRKSRRF